MRLSQTKQIGDFSYTVTQVGATTGRKIFVRLVKMLGAAFGNDPVNGVLSSLNDADFEYLCDEFAKYTVVEIQGKSPQLSAIFEEHFAGRYLAMLQWLGFCLEVNFADFFDEMKKKTEGGGDLATLLTSKLKSQTA